MPNRIDLDALSKPAQRQAVDANWSPRRKKITAVLAVIGGVGAVTFGTWKAWSMMAPSLPTSAKEAVAVINSSRFENLDEIRKDQYLQEADRLLRQEPRENRQDMWKDPKYRAAMDKIREERMDEAAIKLARGEKLDGPGPGGDRPQPTEEQRKEWEKMRKEWEDREAKMTEAEKQAEHEKREAEMRTQIDKRLSQSINTGNAQSMGLRSEMFQKMRRSGGWGGMRGGRPGGGGGGGRPGGGGPR